MNAPIWILGQDTAKGFRYYTGRAHPICPDAWTPDMRKARRYTWEQSANLREHVSAYTWGGTIKRMKS